MAPTSSGKCVQPSTTVSTRASRCARYRSATASTAGPFAPALFRQRDEDLGRHLRHVRVGPQREDRALIGAALHGAFGREHRDAAAGGGFAGRLRAGLDDADARAATGIVRASAGNAVAEAVLQATTSALMSRLDERLGRAHRITRDRLGALGAVRQPRGVAEIEEILVRQLARSARAAP